jgi:hypothetical protein
MTIFTPAKRACPSYTLQPPLIRRYFVSAMHIFQEIVLFPRCDQNAPITQYLREPHFFLHKTGISRQVHLGSWDRRALNVVLFGFGLCVDFPEGQPF